MEQSDIFKTCKKINSEVQNDCETKLRDLSLNLQSEECDTGIDHDCTPKAECIPEGSWLKNDHASIDLDEKFDSMTGSYSEILENNTTGDIKTIKVTSSKKRENITDEIEEDDDWINREKENDLLDGALASLQSENQESLSHSTDLGHIRELMSIEKFGQNLYGSQLPRGGRLCSQPPALIDPDVLTDLEEHARHIATSMDILTENLTDTLHGISALAVDCVETYRDAVCKTCDAVDSNIKSMYQLMAKCEELSKAMKPMYKLQEQIKEIKRLLDLFENAVYSGGT